MATFYAVYGIHCLIHDNMYYRTDVVLYIGRSFQGALEFSRIYKKSKYIDAVGIGGFISQTWNLEVDDIPPQPRVYLRFDYKMPLYVHTSTVVHLTRNMNEIVSKERICLISYISTAMEGITVYKLKSFAFDNIKY